MSLRKQDETRWSSRDTGRNFGEAGRLSCLCTFKNVPNAVNQVLEATERKTGFNDIQDGAGSPRKRIRVDSSAYGRGLLQVAFILVRRLRGSATQMKRSHQNSLDSKSQDSEHGYLIDGHNSITGLHKLWDGIMSGKSTVLRRL